MIKRLLLAALSYFAASLCIAAPLLSNNGSGGPPATLRQAATRTYLPSGSSVSGTANTRRYFFARANITQLKIILPNYFVTDTGVETGTGATTTVNGALIEYPPGTCTTVLFGGSATTTIANNSQATSDFVTVSIPAGAKFFVSTSQTNSSATPIAQGDNSTAIPADTANGDALNLSGGSITCGAITDIGHGVTGPDPVAVIANSNVRAFALIGDSRTFGLRDSYVNSSGDLGELARSIGPNFAYANFGISGSGSAAWLTPANTVNRTALLQYFTDEIIDYGINDVGAIPPSTIVSNEQAITALQAMTHYYLTTTSPHTSSTDNWVTTANQTVTISTVPLNTAQRAATGFTSIFDIASTTDSSFNSNLWVVSPSPPYTTDGLHEDSAGYLLIQSSGVISP